MRLVLHQSFKDLRQHRRLVLAWVIVLALRATVVVYPFDVQVPALAESAISGVYLALNIVMLALSVVLAVLVVQADPGAGTTAFWLTRPIGRPAMAAVKVLTVLALCAALPVVVDVLVLTAHRLPLADVLRAAEQGTVERLALVVPAMALAAVTADLAGVALAGLGALAGLFASVVLVTLLWAGNQARPAYESALLLEAGLVIAAGLLVVTLQYLRRSRRDSVALIAVALVASGLLMRFWTVDFFSTGRAADASLIAASDVRLEGVPEIAGVRRREGGTEVIVSGVVVSSQPRPDILVTPWALDARLTLEGSEPVDVSLPGRGTDRALMPGAGSDTARAAGAALGNVVVVQPNRNEAAGRASMVLMRLDEPQFSVLQSNGGRYDARVTLRATGYEAAPGVRLHQGAGGRAGDRRFNILSTRCSGAACDVLLRDVVAVFFYDTRVPSKVSYLLVNRRRGVALIPTSDDLGVLGETGYAFGHHLAITRRALRFSAPEGEPAIVGAEWLDEGELVPIVATELGNFTRPLVFPDFRAVVAPARGPAPAGPEGGR